MNTDESKRRRRGPAPLDATDKRGHTVSVRLNDAELARLDSQRDAVQMQRASTYAPPLCIACRPPSRQRTGNGGQSWPARRPT
jgi:hypothetical protein